MWKQKSKILVTCPKGITPYLMAETAGLGLPGVTLGEAAVEMTGTLADCMMLNLYLRTGHRVLFLLDSFPAKNTDELYSRLFGITWERMIYEDDYISVTSTVDNETVVDNRFVNVRGKDAVVDRIRKKCGRRPDSGPDRKRVVIHLFWRADRVSVYLDTSGEPLNKRGYRKIPMLAPMQETLAAAVVMATGWNGSGVFVNPMCGSGTLAIEAALIAINKAPGLLRKNFGFMHLKGFDAALWQKMITQAGNKAGSSFSGKIVATDINRKAVLSSMQNSRNAGVEQFIEFKACDYSKTPIPENKGIILFNPGYGLRIGEIKELETVYQGIGDFFKTYCKGYLGFIFTGNLDLAKRVGLRTKRRMPFYNGEIECRLLAYDLYEGSKKKRVVKQEMFS